MPTDVKQELILKEAIGEINHIATLPEITLKIIELVEDPKSTASQLHKIVAHDPALVTRILKVVNSSFYGLPGQIASIDRAIVLLGLNAVKNIAVGVAARDMAKQMKLPVADEAFLAGMIHDMGILISMQVHPEQVKQVCEASKAGDKSFCELEREVIGMDHQQLGMALAEQWKFPRACQLVAGYHHRPQALAEQNRLLVTLVFVADTICCQSKHGFNLTALGQRLDAAGLADIKLDPAMVERTVANLDELVKTASDMLA